MDVHEPAPPALSVSSSAPTVADDELAQETTTCAYPSMAQSAISNHLDHGAIALPSKLAVDHPLQSGLKKVLALLRTHNGQDFSQYKKSTLYRRIERRMDVHRIGRIANYVSFVEQNPQELDLLFRELLIGVTHFFRDPPVWESLDDQAFPALFARTPAGRALRAWVAACSTGEEAYSLAIAFREALDKHQPAGRFSLQIFATDLDGDAINRARQGRYPATIAAEVSAARLARFFIATEGSYQVSKEIREMVIFAPQNITQDPPFTNLDLLLCRNVLIYFGHELQKTLFPLFHHSLTPGGVLVLGTCETVGIETDLFTPIDAKARIFRRSDIAQNALEIPFPAYAPARPVAPDDLAAAAPAANLQVLADQLLLQQFAPAAVLVNDRGDIVYIHGRIGPFLEPAAGKANWNIHAMVRDGLRQELGNAWLQVTHHRGRVERSGISVSDDGKTRTTDLTVLMIEEPPPLHGMVLVVFSEPAPQPAPTDTPGAPG